MRGPKGDASSHRSSWPVQQASYFAFSQINWRGLLTPFVQINDDGTLYIEPPSDSCEVTRVCQDMLKGIGIVVSPTEGRSPTGIESVNHIHFECTCHFRLMLIDEGALPILARISTFNVPTISGSH
ncbi:hypothetical protein K443DRAFT_90444 [Laccaria amethystina LaAM-08-1]|uniref:Uncharacterized protein n=1 Tax=Laccaria amethystina LaAM-08-1 TaxID=1095629 RepID=A0A0C9XWN8_9AGAR|nr:hypothetical protein K443DRAFT_90444 [Laccaria amethystina LaAM-08-1]